VRPLPWRTREPGHGGYQWCVLDADGWLVCECDGEDEGRAEAKAIVAAVNRVHVLGPMVRALESLRT
jgi:hypothetical protein